LEMRREAAVGAQLHAGVRGGAQKAVNNCLRGIGDGEHAAIALGFEFHAAGFEPGDGVARLENFVRGQQGPPAARIAGGQFARVEAGMGDVAAAPAGNADFGRGIAPSVPGR
jgi:hypothetical protein